MEKSSFTCLWVRLTESFRISSKFKFLFLISLAGFSLTSQARAECATNVGRFVDIHGQVETQVADGDAWLNASLDTQLCEGSSIRVGAQSRAAISLINDAVLRLDENTTMRLVNIVEEEEEQSLLDIIKGAIHSFSRKPKKLMVNSAYLNGSIEGTEFVFRVTDEQSELTVFEGTVVAANDQGSASVTTGESVVAQQDQAPVERILVNPRDQVQWGLFYPPILAAGADASEDLTKAASLLNAGRVEAARTQVDQLISSDSSAGLAYALRAIINVTQNKVPEALNDARQAVELEPASSAARIALSYAQQANLDLDSALATLQKAVADQPDDVLALARLAELQLMRGELTKANENAAKASGIAPDLAHAQKVLGFSALTTTDIQTAKSAFTRAITLDSADPMSRLGLGLAKIREGALTEGRKDLEAAVALGSNNALLRSYLGKAYFEEKRGPLDDEQLDIAKQLDPNDPTAWLYSAIRAQTEGQPVEALEELQGSIERNDNRAVYRSRLLLDSDQAARSASLARVYSDLGFEQLALSEGWKSVNTDPTNSSAHRFLADSYAALPRHEIARVSELLQSQLLQPLNATPLQPTLAESDLRLISAGGPATAAYNEFNALFNRNQNNFLLNAMGGELDTSAGEAIVAGIHNKISYSLGVTEFETDGFRENNDQEDQIANVFIQMDLSAQTSVQFEYRTRESEFGDYQLNFFEDNFDPTLRNDIDTDTARIGLRHNLSPQDILLASIISQERDAEFTTTQPPVGPLGPITIEVSEPDNKGKGIEIQHLHRSSAFNLTSGVGYFDIDREQVSGISSDPATCGFLDAFLNPPGPNCSASSTDTSAKHKNVYLYSTMPVSKNLALTLGASYDDFDTDNTTSSESKDQFNPKLGVSWDIQPNTTLRAAAFKTLNRVLITQQTLEPTQVAGFNQFYDDVESTEAVRYGVALDHRFSNQMYGGIEFSERDLEVPIPVPGPSGVELTRLDWDEELDRAYLFLAPADWVALSIEFQNEVFDRPDSGNLSPEVKTRKLPLGVRLFSGSGWNFAFTATYIDQEGDFLNPATSLFESESDDFWVADTSVSYQLPKRRGYVSIGATNLTDEQFSYQETDLLNSTLVPERMAFARLTLTLP